MVEIYGASSSPAGVGADPEFDNPGTSSHTVDKVRIGRASDGSQWNVADDLRRRRRADLFFEDSIVLLGILLGGAVGYMTATTVRKTTWSSNPPRRASRRWEHSRTSSQQGRDRTSNSVEKDETTDLIASNKVEGTAVYNRQGERLGEVYNFMVGKRSGEVAYAIMSFGGFLGIGQKYHPLPWNALTYHTDKNGYVIDADKDRLMRAPSYSASEEPFSRREYGQQVRDYWSAGLT